MGIEIERKFLVTDDRWRQQIERSIEMRQGYLAQDERRAIRVRIFGNQAHINIKASDDGIHRHEFEYAIPLADARDLFEHVVEDPVVEKIRHEVHVGEHPWEVDEFLGANAPLVVAEVELAHADEAFERPPLARCRGVRGQALLHSSLALRPYSRW